MNANYLVLVIEHNEADAHLAEALFSAAGLDVRVCADAESGLETFRSLKPDLVLIDAGVPSLGGDDLCRVIKQSRHGQLVPVIRMSGPEGGSPRTASKSRRGRQKIVVPVERRKRSAELSADGFSLNVQKPLTSKALLDMLFHFLPQACTIPKDREPASSDAFGQVEAARTPKPENRPAVEADEIKPRR